MRILILTQWFDPEPTFKGLLFAKSLRDAGNDVEVITGFPNYPEGKVYPGYRMKWRQRENIDGIKVTRLPLYPSHDGSAIRRVLNYVSFAVSSCLYGIFGLRKIDIIYVYHPPMTVGLAAAIIGFFRRIPFVLDIQDLWPDTLRATGMLNSAIFLGIVNKCCQWIYSRAAHIVVLSPGFRRLLIRRRVSDIKIDVIYNWCDEQNISDYCETDISKFIMPGYFNVVFAGNMGRAQALTAVLLAAKQVEQTNEKVQFVFIGSGIEVGSLKQFAKDHQIRNAKFLPHVPINEIGNFLQAADVLLVHLKDDPLFEVTIPSKTQAYLAIGKPVLMAVRGDAAELSSVARAGCFAQPENPVSISNAVLEMAALSSGDLAQMGLNAKKFYYDNLSLAVGVRKFIEVFERVLSNR